MGFRVQLAPSGRVFSAEPQETLLEAALRSGVNIHYNCSSGSCGECRARVIDGAVEDRRFHDYVLTEQERNTGIVLLCTTHAASDLVIEARVTGSAEELPLQQINAKIAKTEALSEAVVMLLLRTPRSQTLRFMAGQHVELRAAGHCIDVPVASCPCNGMQLQFHLLRGRDDAMLSWLMESARHSESVQIDGPFGNFLLNEQSTHEVVMVGQENGFAPLKSLIEHYINLEKPQPLHLHRLAHCPQGLYLENLCESWRDALDNFTYSSFVSESDEALLGDMQQLAAALANPLETDVYLAIAEEMSAAVQQIFLQRGVPPQQLFVEHHRGILRQEPLSGAINNSFT